MIFRFFLLGAVQGLTEFLPVSSSGHLVIFQKLLNIAEGNVSFDIIIHLASLSAVLFFFRHDFLAIFRKLSCSDGKAMAVTANKGEIPQPNYPKIIIFIFCASLVTALIGFKFKERFESLFSSLGFVVLGLVITGIILFLTKFKADVKAKNQDKLNIWDGLIVGLAQSLAIAPGISRSGLTISAGLFMNIERRLAVRLSFLLSIPAILGAAIFKIKDLEAVTIAPAYLIASFISAFIFSFLALKLLVLLVEKLKLHYFAYYCWLVAALVFFFAR